MKKEIVIDGSRISDKKTLFEELNRKFMQGEDWEIGESLDAFNDILYGGVGVIKGNEPILLTWKNFEESAAQLGREFTIDFYQQKLQHPELFDATIIQERLDELRNNKGQTYIEIILEMIAEHRQIEFVKA
ncbi:barstar family protein [Sphingobacterium humi]|uniref:Ribonuclease inhibitor n=1 Tax=Sphingobacterium humi TaxID=1796905 RepID=A0A6N8KUU9_9SPHI|nr:barstar family protein [Sphingobacterium humi]MVZ61135.1 ribonuclease inhibitor [Sphingobacterium humi]